MDLFNQIQEQQQQAEEPNFTVFNNLTPYEKKCLLTNNYWRIRNGIEPIAVPETEESYHIKWKEVKEKALQDKCK